MDIESIKKFVDSSKSCHQFTRVDCKHMGIFKESDMSGYLVDRENTAMGYFGGGPENGAGIEIII